MTDHSTTGEPRTEAGRRLAALPLVDGDDAPLDLTDDILAIEREAADIDVQAARLVFHEEYERDESGDRYYGCQHRNQHRSTWDCQQRVEEFAAHYARLRASDTATGSRVAVGDVRFRATDGDLCWAVEVFQVEIGVRDPALVGPEPRVRGDDHA